MDCHVFRRLCAELGPALIGCRLEKIHQPAPDVTLFTFYGKGRKRFLFLKAGRKAPFLFLSDHKVASGSAPSAFVMLLRKHLADRRVLDAVADWVERRLYLRFTPPRDPSGPPASLPSGTTETGDGGEENALWLCLDLRGGPALLHRTPDEPMPPRWPRPADAASLARDGDWRAWPVLTPALRRTLVLLPLEEQAALLADLETGGGDLFLYRAAPSAPAGQSNQAGQAGPESRGKDGPTEIFAWPLPDALRHSPEGRRDEEVMEDVLAAAALAGESRVLGELAAEARAQRAKPHAAEAARLRRLLAKLDAEETRLARMRDAQHAALALQAALYRFAPDEKRAEVTLDAPAGEPAQATGALLPLTVPLDPRLTVRENMAALFHTARRGQRGLVLLAGRREAVAADLERAEQAALRAQAGFAPQQAAPAALGRGSRPAPPPPGAPHPGKAGRSRMAAGGWPKNVQVFRSSDGFLLLRGRDAAGNAAVLKLAAPHDLWLHAGGGPGAHVIIRRDHAGQTIPAATLEEAGGLAILKSWKKDERPADVITALAGRVRPMQGARAGEVRVDKYEESLSVTPDPSLERRLAV